MFNPKFRTFLEANGLKKEATEAEARGHYESLKARGVTTTEPMDIDDPAGTNTGTRSGGTPPPPSATPATDPAPTPEPSAALKAEQERLAEIDMYLRAYPQAEGLRGMLLGDKSYSGDKIAKAVGNFISGRANNSLPGNFGGAGTSITVGPELWDHERAAIVDGICLKAGKRPARINPVTGQPERMEKYAEGAERYRGYSLIRVAQLLLAKQGIPVDRYSNAEIITRAMSRSSQTSYDFPLIMGDVANKILAETAAYLERDWLPFVEVVTLDSMRRRHVIEFGGNNEFGERLEGGEYPTAYYEESGQSWKPARKGLKSVLTFEMIEGDELNVFTKRALNDYVAMLNAERRQFFRLLKDNKKMSDGQPLFSPAHNNISTVSMTRGDYASMVAAMEAGDNRLFDQVNAVKMATRGVKASILCNKLDHRMLFEHCAAPTRATLNNMAGVPNVDYGTRVIKAPEVENYFYMFTDPNIPGQASIEAGWYLGNMNGNTFSNPHYAGDQIEYTTWSISGMGVIGHHGVDRTTVVLPTP